MVLRYILLAMHLLNPLLLTVTCLVRIYHTITVIDTQVLQFSATTYNAAMDTFVHAFLDLCENLFGLYTKNGISGGFPSKTMSSSAHPGPHQLYLPLRALFLQL